MRVGAIEHGSHGMHLDLCITSKYFNPHLFREEMTLSHFRALLEIGGSL